MGFEGAGGLRLCVVSIWRLLRVCLSIYLCLDLDICRDFSACPAVSLPRCCLAA